MIESTPPDAHSKSDLKPMLAIAGRGAGVAALGVTSALLVEAAAYRAGLSEFVASGVGIVVGVMLGLAWGILAFAISRLPTWLAKFAWPAIGLVGGLWLASRVGAFARLGDAQYRKLAILILLGSIGYGVGCGIVLAWANGSFQFPASKKLRDLFGAHPLWFALFAALVAGALGIVEHKAILLTNYPAMQTALRLGSWLFAAFAIAAIFRNFRKRNTPRKAAIALRIACALFAILALTNLQLRDATTIAPTMARGQMRQAIEITRFFVDFDRDGYSSWLAGGDCAPWDSDINPGAAEISGNGIDDNCQQGDAAPGVAEVGNVNDAPLPTSPSPCSVVLVTIDSVRYNHTSLGGYSRDTTPVLSALAKKGVSFSNAFTTGTWTSIAIPTLLRGRYPRYLQWTGIYETDLFRLVRPSTDALFPNEIVRIMFALPLDDTYPTLGEWLARRGMHTMAAVNDGIAEFLSEKVGTARGFREFYGLDKLPPLERDDKVLVDRAMQMMAKVPADQPFFLWVHLFAPHLPNEAHPEGPDFGSEFIDIYDKEIWYADSQLGRIVDAINARTGLPVGLVVAADHGEKISPTLRLHGIDLDEPSVRVPLVVSGCGFDSGKTEAAPASLVDISPTILAMTQTPAPTWLDGKNLAAPPAQRILHTDLWRFDRNGRAVLDMTGATNGQQMLTLDLLTNTISTTAFSGQPAVSSDQQTQLENAARSYLEKTGGRLQPK